MVFKQYDDVHALDGFEVVAVGGEGVYVVDGAGRCWCLAGHDYLQAKGGRMADAYREATE